MFSCILVPVDGSAASARAVETAIAMAVPLHASVAIVSVIDPFAFTGVGSDMAYGQNEYLEAAHAQANVAIQAGRRHCADSGVEVTSSVVEGQAVYSSIIEAAEARQCRHDHHGFPRPQRPGKTHFGQRHRAGAVTQPFASDGGARLNPSASQRLLFHFYFLRNPHGFAEPRPRA